MRAGQLRTLVRLEEPAEGAPDALGAPTGGWRPLGMAWVGIEQLSGRELEAARQVEPRASLRVTMRWQLGMHNRIRFVVPAQPGRPERVLLAAGPPANEGERDRMLVFVAIEGGA